jgi:ankyrin repeat protein
MTKPVLTILLITSIFPALPTHKHESNSLSLATEQDMSNAVKNDDYYKVRHMLVFNKQLASAHYYCDSLPGKCDKVIHHVGSESIACMLINCGADVNAPGMCRLRPLHYTAQNNNLKVAAHLIQRGANVNLATNGKITPVHRAICYGHLDMIRMLIKHGAITNTKTALYGTPLSCAIDKGYTTIERLLRMLKVLNSDFNQTPCTPKVFFKKIRTKEYRSQNNITTDTIDLFAHNLLFRKKVNIDQAFPEPHRKHFQLFYSGNLHKKQCIKLITNIEPALNIKEATKLLKTMHSLYKQPNNPMAKKYKQYKAVLATHINRLSILETCPFSPEIAGIISQY